MTDKEYEKAKGLFEKRNYYYNLAQQVRLEQDRQQRANERIEHKYGSYIGLKYFSLRFWNRQEGKEKKATIGLLPHYEFAREIEIEADKELIDVIYKWVMKKCEELEKQIDEI